MDIEIREYKEQDFSQVRDVLLECFAVDEDPVRDNLLNRFNNSNVVLKFSDKYCGIVACCDSRIVGFLLLTLVLDPVLDTNYCLVDYVCVSRNYQNKGIGTLLIIEAEKVARERKCVYIQLSASKFRVFAHALYKKCGFVIRESDMFRKVL